ncbi:FGGY-family carbohydrate kinase [Fulvimarina sp. 2208YS6-2-32]|uniref:FGGY-family carbohydrate kinase n=1 Tax=Fulvimarina uroteuthidis TaxID=3098149 RepID=A0ABU5I005_9HYPH|nr:FGGY-family carbohydrate kinase [Fulvimarina sp. 2208YS6-2-32]MDY8108721.1 FGGY-family carbohydrate kinase [Fulvimarina sp. 2208YS6-2-32]
MAGDIHLLGVDVGTGSARAGVFDRAGRMLGSDKAPIAMTKAPGGIVEQSSTGIWEAVCRSVKGALKASTVPSETIAGIGFDATCSLVVLGEGGRSLPVSDATAPERDVIVWMDHRAADQARRINAGEHEVLRYVGGTISPEMQTPKLLWLRENRPEIFEAAWQFFDLTDFLTWRATGALERSSCTVTCKWTYLAHEKRWDADYFRAIGLGALADEGFERIGTRVVSPGTALGEGLTTEAARELGLLPGTPVGAGLIDSHAGGVGTVGPEGGAESNLAYVFGTSSCTMTTTTEPVFVPGVWGPYYDAMVPGLWLNEGGQSAAGAAIAHLLRHHPFSAKAEVEARKAGMSLPDWLAVQAAHRVESPGDAVKLASGVHVVPEFLGNRAPYADPKTRAVIAGLGMDDDLDSLLALYVAGLCGVGYGLRQIVEAQERQGIAIARVVLSGGAGRHPVVRQILADASGMEFAIPDVEEPVILGSAILGAVAGIAFKSIAEAMESMSRFAETITVDDATRDVHRKRFDTFKSLQAVARSASC